MVKTTTTKPDNDLLELLNIRLSLSNKFAKNWQDDVKKWQKDYNIQTIKDAKFENLDNQMQIPYIFSTIESGTSNIFEKFPQIIMTQRGKEDREFTEFAESIWDYLKEKLNLEEKCEDAGMSFLTDGQSTTKYGWDLELTEIQEPMTDETGQPVMGADGQPMTEPVNVPTKNLPFVQIHEFNTVLFSPESKFVLDDVDNLIPYVICVKTLTKDQAEEDYEIKVEDEELETINLDEIEKTGELTKEENSKDLSTDLKRVKVYEYYGILPKDYLDKKDNYKAKNNYYQVFTKKRLIKEPVQIKKKPLLNLGHYGLPNRFWRFGEPKVLRELEQDVSLGRSRIMDLRDRQGTKVGVPQGTEFDEESFKKSRDYTFLRYIGNSPPIYINPPPLPETLMTSIQQSRDDIQMASATMDISRASMENTVDTATGQKIFAGETNKRNAKKKKKIARYLKALAQNLLILCGENWDEDTFAQITDLPVEEIQKRNYKQLLAELGNDYDVEINIDTLGDTKETDAANAIALFRDMKDSQYINQEELIKFVLETGFKQKDATRFLNGNISPETMIAVLQKLLETGIIAEEDAQVIIQKMQMQTNPEGMPAEEGQVGTNEGRPPTGNPVDIVKKSMPGTNTTQMSSQRQAAYKQTNVPKGPQNVR
jgi:hypothetical protein